MDYVAAPLSGDKPRLGLARSLPSAFRLPPALLGLILAWAFFASPALGQGRSGLAQPTDLREEASQIAASGRPLVVLFSQRNCSWCDHARMHLIPMSLQTDAAALFRQIDLDSDAPLIDFAGRATTQRRFAREQNARFTPTLTLYGPDGQILGEPILGMRLPDFYSHYVEQAILQARSTLQP